MASAGAGGDCTPIRPAGDSSRGLARGAAFQRRLIPIRRSAAAGLILILLGHLFDVRAAPLPPEDLDLSQQGIHSGAGPSPSAPRPSGAFEPLIIRPGDPAYGGRDSQANPVEPSPATSQTVSRWPQQVVAQDVPRDVPQGLYFSSYSDFQLACSNAAYTSSTRLLSRPSTSGNRSDSFAKAGFGGYALVLLVIGMWLGARCRRGK